jgi:hypothetical protein
MARYLVVAHETVTNPALLDQLKAVTKEDPEAEYTLLVPATPVRHLVFRRHRENEAESVARKLADKAQSMFTRKGVNVVAARIGPESPMDAVDAEVDAHPGYAGFIISTLPAETSRWLRLDLPRQVEQKYRLPVFHVHPADDWSPGDLP